MLLVCVLVLVSCYSGAVSVVSLTPHEYSCPSTVYVTLVTEAVDGAVWACYSMCRK